LLYIVYTSWLASTFTFLFFCLNLPQGQLAHRLLLIVTLSLPILMKYCIWCGF